jgi:hypothetical protein
VVQLHGLQSNNAVYRRRLLDLVLRATHSSDSDYELLELISFSSSSSSSSTSTSGCLRGLPRGLFSVDFNSATYDFQHFLSTKYKFALQLDSLALSPFLPCFKYLFIIFHLFPKNGELSILTFN